MFKKTISTILALALMVSVFAGCNSGGASSSSTTSKETGNNSTSVSTTDEGNTDTSEAVNVVLYLYGSQGTRNPEIIAQLNEKLTADINATLEVKYIDWGDIATKYPLLWASGEQFDMAYVSSGSSVPYSTLVKQDVLVDITDMLDSSAPTLKAALAEDVWKSVQVDGKIHAVPSSYSEFTVHGFVSRTDLMEKYGIDSISSIENMEAYLDAALADGKIPLNGNSNMAYDMYNMFVAMTEDWILAPGLSNGVNMTFAGKATDPSKILSPVFEKEFEDFVVKMREWSDKEYWSKDILSSSKGAKDNFNDDLSAAYLTHQPDWTGNHGTMIEKLGEGYSTEFYPFAEEHDKILRKSGVENATGISVNSKNPERTLMVIEKLMTDETCYKLFQYGITGEQYIFEDNMAIRPENYDPETMGGGFGGWAFRTDDLNIPYDIEDPRRYTLNEAWEKVALDNPYVGFTFDNANVTSELSAVTNVDSQLGIQLLLGKTTDDPLVALEQYRTQLKTAGIDAIIDDVNEQYAAYLAENS